MSHAQQRLTTALADRYTIEPELGGGGLAGVFVALARAIRLAATLLHWKSVAMNRVLMQVVER